MNKLIFEKDMFRCFSVFLVFLVSIQILIAQDDYMIKENVLQVTIQDDGIGRAHSKKISRKNIEKQTSSGIKTTLERVDLLNFGKDKKLNTVQIEDLFNKDGNAAGTKTTLQLAISEN